MSKQNPSQLPVSGSIEGSTPENRYYVQHLTQQIFVVRERLSADGAPGADDRIVRSFNVLHDAYMYINDLNGTQSKTS